MRGFRLRDRWFCGVAHHLSPSPHQAESYMPPESHGPQPQMLSHEAACLLNISDQNAP